MFCFVFHFPGASVDEDQEGGGRRRCADHNEVLDYVDAGAGQRGLLRLLDSQTLEEK